MKVFYRPEQNAVNAGSYSPSANKPQQVVADWLKHGIITPDDIESFEPVTREDLYLAHDAAHVDGVLNLTKRNGFGNTNAEVAESLRYTSGSLNTPCCTASTPARPPPGSTTPATPKAPASAPSTACW